MGIEEEKKEESESSTQASSSAAAQQVGRNDPDERPINATGMYDLSAFQHDFEIEEIDDFEEVKEARFDQT